MKRLRQSGIFGSATASSVGGSAAKSASKEREASRALMALVLLLSVLFVIFLVVELNNLSKDKKGDRAHVRVSSDSFVEENDGQRQPVGQRLIAREASERIKGRRHAVGEGHSDGSSHGGLDHSYHLIGGPLSHSGKQHGSKHAPLLNAELPNVYERPWLWGIRSDAGYGGGEDEEMFMSVAQGDPQPLSVDTLYYQSSDTQSSDVKQHIQSQIDEINKRYYDAPEMLFAYQRVMSNQHGLVKDGDPKPLQELRAREDELPPLNW
eukprot:GILI01014609.1.p1 GENE.GILI01014609.1~~GILI01014609.1.p1  ORF type:complete len:265 (-),score=31.77 GILI01014609.1:144-938(-)